MLLFFDVFVSFSPYDLGHLKKALGGKRAKFQIFVQTPLQKSFLEICLPAEEGRLFGEPKIENWKMSKKDAILGKMPFRRGREAYCPKLCPNPTLAPIGASKTQQKRAVQKPSFLIV